MGKDASEIRREIAETRERMGDTVEAIGYKADVPSRMRDAVNERVESVKETFSSAVQAVTDATGSVSGNVKDQVDTIRGNVGDVDVQGSAKRAVSMAAENPLGIALGALAAGFLVGLIVPMSDGERLQAGKIKRAVTQRAETAVEETISAGREIVEEAVQTAMSSAKTRGATIADHALHPETVS